MSSGQASVVPKVFLNVEAGPLHPNVEEGLVHSPPVDGFGAPGLSSPHALAFTPRSEEVSFARGVALHPLGVAERVPKLLCRLTAYTALLGVAARVSSSNSFRIPVIILRCEVGSCERS